VPSGRHGGHGASDYVEPGSAVPYVGTRVSFLDRSDGVTTLAAVFHDLVYLQVDGGLSDDAVNLLSPYVGPSKTGFSFNTPAIQDDRAFQLCCALFGRDPQNPKFHRGR